MGKVNNLAKRVFGRLTVLQEVARSASRNAIYKCRCECGTLTDVRDTDLRSGGTQSCGCGRGLNLKGKTFGRLTAQTVVSKTRLRKIWRCSCTCGNTTDVLSTRLKNENTQSCGCLARETAAALCRNNELLHKRRIECSTTHGQSRTREHACWNQMLQRCTNPKVRGWKNYGGANPPIQVCERWMTFEKFFNDLGAKPEGTTLGRACDLANYEPEGAFWQTDAEQSLAKRNKRALLKWLARQQTFAQAA